MVKSGYKKFLKKERAKVKLKGGKKLLPKGQNVTDVNFRVKKIIIRGQLKEHLEGEILSQRKLNVKDLLSRISHHNTKTKFDALTDLEAMLTEKGEQVLNCYLSEVVIQLAKVISVDIYELRKKANSLLKTVLTSVTKDKCNALYGVVISRVCCGLTSLDQGIRFDSLKTLDTLADCCPSKLVSSAGQLLPILMDLISSGHQSGSKCTLTVHVGQKESAGKWRAEVLCRINIILDAYYNSFIESVAVSCDRNEKLISSNDVLFIPNHCCFQYPYDQYSLSLVDDEFSYNVSDNNQFDFKELSILLVPLMLSAFTELMLNDNDQESSSIITEEASLLLKSIIDVSLTMRNLITKTDSNNPSWWNKNFGPRIHTKLVVNKFPYKTGFSGIKKKNHLIIDGNLSVTNLKLALLTLQSVNHSQCPEVISFMKQRIRVINSLTSLELQLLKDCLLLILEKNEDDSTYFLNAVIKMFSEKAEVQPISHEILSSVALDPRLSYLHQEENFVNWVGSLLEKLVNQAVPNLDIVMKIACRSYKPFIESLDSFIEPILDNLPKLKVSAETKMKISSLIYWVTDWDEELLDNLSRGIASSYWGETISTHLLHLVLTKSLMCDELKQLLSSQEWWKKYL